MCLRVCVYVVMCLTPVLSGGKGCQQANLSRWLSKAGGIAKVESPCQGPIQRGSLHAVCQQEGLALLQVSIAFTGCLLFFGAAA